MRTVRYGSALCIAVSILAFYSTSQAAVHQVQNATQLHAALTTSQNNGVDDTIRLAQGTYIGNFVYSSHANGGLTVEGGWTADFSSRKVSAENTVLDGNKTGNTFVFSCD